MKLRKEGLGKSLILGATAGLAFGSVGVLGTGSATAATTAAAAPGKITTLNYMCTYPLIGARSVKVNVETNIPEKLGVNQPMEDIQINFTADLGADTTEGLRAIDGVEILGEAKARATLSGIVGGSYNLVNAIKPTPIPEEGPFTLSGYGEMSGLEFSQTGSISAALTGMEFTILVKKKDGTSSALGEFHAPCTLNPGQDATVAKMEVVSQQQQLPPKGTVPGYYPFQKTGAKPGTLLYNFTTPGSSFIKGPNGTVKLSGDIGVKVDGGTGEIKGDLKLAKTGGKMSILGFLPVDAEVDFKHVDDADGTDTVGTFTNGEIRTKSTLWIYLPSFKLLGIPLGGGAQCRAKTPSVIDMHSKLGTFFNPKKGGEFKADNYAIAPLENCGPLNGILTIFASQSGNTIDMNLTPKTS